MRRHVRIAFLGLVVLFIGLASLIRAQQAFIVVDDEQSIKDLLPMLTQGAGQASLEKEDVYKDDADGKAALKVTGEGGDGQKFNPNMPGWQLKIVKNPDPKADDEFRYITFAWRKEGGNGIQLQLHATTNTWGHRYHAGANVKNWNPSIQVSPDVPREWEIHTRDLVDDWGEMVITGIAFTAWDLDYGVWDHVVFHQTEEDPLAIKAVDPRLKLSLTWGQLKQGF